MNETQNKKELAIALCKAQSQALLAIKDTDNPFFKKKYADLTSVWAACREALTSNGFCVTQYGEDRGPEYMVLVTELIHSSGQSIRSEFPICFIIPAGIDKKTGKETPEQRMTPQDVGIATTYFRRYALAAIAGVCVEDEDANSISPTKNSTPAEPLINKTQIGIIQTELAKCPSEYRDYYMKEAQRCFGGLYNMPMSVFETWLDVVKTALDQSKGV